MTLRSGYWQDLTTEEFGALDASRTIAILPVAAIEQHGPHLPLATDAIINAGVLDEVLRRLAPSASSASAATPSSSVLVLPAQNIGDSLEHGAFAGTLRAEYDTLVRSWTDIGHAVARAGIRKLVIFNSHGGQKAHVDLVAVRLRVAHAMLVVRAHTFSFGVPPGLFEADELAHGIHAGAVETSLVMHLRPDLVRSDKLADFASVGREMARSNKWLGVEKPIGFGWMSQDLNPHGACGNAAEASAEKGRLVFEHYVTGLVQLIAEVERTSPPDAAPSSR